MNIFALSTCPKQSAHWHMSRHVYKMPLEYAQLLCTASCLNGMPQGYKPTHIKHVSTQWAAASLDNWLWLKELALYLGSHYKRIRKREHKSIALIKTLKTPDIPQHGLQPVTLAMYPWIKRLGYPHIRSYRTFYRSAKLHIAEWPHEKYVPDWWDNPRYFMVPPDNKSKLKLLTDMYVHHKDAGIIWLQQEWKKCD